MRFKKLTRYTTCVILLFCVSLIADAQTDQSQPTAEHIVFTSLEKFFDDTNYMSSSFSHEEHEITQELNNSNKITDTKDKVWLVMYIDRALRQKLIINNGTATADSSFESKKERLVLNSDFFKHYCYWLIKEENNSEGSYWIIGFKSKDQQDSKSQTITEQVLARLSGEIWISKRDNMLKSVIARLPAPFDVALSFPGMSGKAHKIECRVDMDMINGHCAIHRLHYELVYSYRALFYSKKVHTVTHVTYSAYQRYIVLQ